MKPLACRKARPRRRVAWPVHAIGSAWVAAVWLAAQPGVALADGAEYSLRWSPAEGGPASAAETMRRLGHQPGAPERYEVHYYDIDAPADTPPGFDAILRQRHGAHRSELTFKLRGDGALPARPTLKHWHCPLPGAQHRKDEADVAFLAADRTSRTYSRSCSLQAARLEVPAALRARPASCSSAIARLHAGALKVEEWRLGDGGLLLEVSRIADDDAGAAADFRRQVVEPLLALGVKPVQRSKSMIGADCR